MKKALVVVDVQNDFCPGGALPVPCGDEVISVINKIVNEFNVVVLTRDWHPNGHCSFKEQGGLWPVHCVGGSNGALLRVNINEYTDEIFDKGTRKDYDSYSGFGNEYENTGLEDYLKEKEVDEVYICGLATDYCVKATALDAQKKGFKTYVIIDACRGVEVHNGDVVKAIDEMKNVGIKIICSIDVIEGER